jgi:hypothetical protein
LKAPCLSRQWNFKVSAEGVAKLRRNVVYIGVAKLRRNVVYIGRHSEF